MSKERDSERAMRLAEVAWRPWVLACGASGWYALNRETKDSYGPYKKRGNARNRVHVLNAKHREERAS